MGFGLYEVKDPREAAIPATEAAAKSYASMMQDVGPHKPGKSVAGAMESGLSGAMGTHGLGTALAGAGTEAVVSEMAGLGAKLAQPAVSAAVTGGAKAAAAAQMAAAAGTTTTVVEGAAAATGTGAGIGAAMTSPVGLAIGAGLGILSYLFS